MSVLLFPPPIPVKKVIVTKIDSKILNLGVFSLKVLNGQCRSTAFCILYCGLSTNQAIYLGAYLWT